ncbi:hypothetical protein HK103_003995 [Boothiomyces macroporosus]|uniref:B30.2/SPRY domain-containing protein n=1 Tax=Boothiomyces macroporosus TaxID=261099 RepID=A0AAD5UHE2_9FUNG|nr:hypothetical protein HK103_003995 [Boothiomyces macroporosus]
MQILFDRAMSSKHLPYLLECCQSEDNVKRKKAMIIVQQLVGSERNRGVLTRKKLPKILVKSLRLDGDPEIHRYAIVSYGVLDCLIKFLQDEPNRYSDLKFWSISLIHQFSQTDSVSAILIAKKIMNLLTEMVKLNFGNPNVQKLCFHAIVRILSTIDDEDESKQILLELADLKLISLAAGCLRNSDVELASWKLFYKEILKVKLIDKIVKTLQGQEEQTIYWALGLLHMLAFQMPDQKSLFESGALSAMLNIHDSVMLHIHLYVIEIIGVLCTDPLNISSLESSKMVERLISYIQFDDIDIKNTAVTVLVNIASISTNITTQICDRNGVQILIDIILADEADSIRQMASKAILSLANNCEAIRFEIVISLIRPLIYKMFSNISLVVNTINSSESKKTALSPILEDHESGRTHGRPNSRMSNDSYSFSPTRTAAQELPESPVSPQENSFRTNCSKLLTAIECLSILLKSNIFDQVESENHQKFSDYVGDILDDVGTSLLNALVFPLVLTQSNQQVSDELKLEIPKAALECIVNLLYIEFIVNESILSILFVLLSDYGSKISKSITYALPQFVQYNIFREEILYSDTNFSCVLRAVAKLNNEIDWAFFRKFVSRSCDFTAIDYTPTFVSLDQSRSTQFADIEMHSLLCFNRTWTFETAIAKYGVSKAGKWGYEFQLGSAGILQIGWVCSEYTPKEYGGWGVGDDMLSYAFDGARVRKWHGRDVNSDGYGEEWSFRDVVTCLIDFDNGTISYMLNGKDLGVAFENINANEIWYPAVSLTGEQWGTFLFGGELDKLIFCPTEYLPIPVPELDTFHSTEFLNTSNDLSNVDSEVFYSAPALEVEQTNESPQLQSSANLEENFKRIVELIDGKDKSETTFTAKEDLNNVTENLFENRELHIATTTEAVQSDEVSTAEMEGNITDQIPKSPKRKGKLQITTSANLDICMYYEVETGKIYYERCVHIGYITSPKQIISLVYLPHIQVIYLVKLSVAVTDNFLVEDLEKILETDAESPLVHVYYKAKTSLDHRTIGVGIDSTIDSVFFTFDGKRFGPFVPRNATFCTPYIRDLSRYILNFGQYDFVSPECNHSWSPSTFRNKID